MKRLFAIVLLMLVSLAGVAYAADSFPTEGEALYELAKPVFEAIKGGEYALAGALGLIFLVAALKRYGVSRWLWLGRKRGTAFLVLAGAFGASLASSLGTGAVLSWGLLWVAGKFAAVAAGGYALFKDLVVVPLLRPLAAWAPGWLGVPLRLVLWMFDSPRDIDAKNAGLEAARENPPKGVTDITGPPKNVP